MTIRILLLILFCSSVFVSECSSQRLVEQLLEQDQYCRDVERKTKVKSILSREYQHLDDPKRSFNLALLNFHKKESYSNSSLSFDSTGSITKVENEYSAVKKNTNEIATGKSTINWEYKYKDGYLKSMASYSDTIERLNIFSYDFDDIDRIVEINRFQKATNTKESSQFEEIMYFKNGKKSTVYFLRDSLKVFNSEYTYDLKGKLITRKIENNYPKGSYDFLEYFYNEKGMIETEVHLLNLKEGSINGGLYNEYKYNNKGRIKKIKSYNLLYENIEDVNDSSRSQYKEDNGRKKLTRVERFEISIEYRKGNFLSMATFKEKEIGDYLYILRKHKKSGKVKKVSQRSIYDKKGNKVLEYTPVWRKLLIRNITYYN